MIVFSSLQPGPDPTTRHITGALAHRSTTNTQVLQTGMSHPLWLNILLTWRHMKVLETCITHTLEVSIHLISKVLREY